MMIVTDGDHQDDNSACREQEYIGEWGSGMMVIADNAANKTTPRRCMGGGKLR